MTERRTIGDRLHAVTSRRVALTLATFGVGLEAGRYLSARQRDPQHEKEAYELIWDSSNRRHTEYVKILAAVVANHCQEAGELRTVSGQTNDRLLYSALGTLATGDCAFIKEVSPGNCAYDDWPRVIRYQHVTHFEPTEFALMAAKTDVLGPDFAAELAHLHALSDNS